MANSTYTPHELRLTNCTWLDVNPQFTNNLQPERFADVNSVLYSSFFNLMNCPIGARGRIFQPEYGSSLMWFLQESISEITAQKMRLVCTCQDNAQAMQVQPRPATPVKSAVAIERTPSPPENEPVIPAGDYQDDIPMPTDDDYSVSEDINYDELTPENKHTLETAMEIFGGKIIPEDEMNN